MSVTDRDARMVSGRTKGGAARSKGRKKKAKGADSGFFDSKAGIIIATFLSLVLWWVPYLGPITAGFMGGRKAGSLFRGAMVGFVSLVLVLLISTVLSVGVAAIISDYGDAVESFSPFIYEKVVDLSSYLEGFVTVSGTSIVFDQSNYFLMVALCVIGGAFADQHRREVKAIVGLAKESSQAPVPRSVKAYKENRTLGFQSYEDYARMSVNVATATEAKPAPKKQPQRTVVDTPAPEPAVRPQPVQSAGTVVTSTMTTATPTMNVPDQPVTTTKPPQAKDDYDYL